MRLSGRNTNDEPRVVATGNLFVMILFRNCSNEYGEISVCIFAYVQVDPANVRFYFFLEAFGLADVAASVELVKAR
jgi:hypothetical protein